MPEKPEFAGQLVVVTGAASGIGRATALAFARAAAELFVCDLPSADLPGLQAELLAAGAPRAQAYAVDVGAREQMEHFCESVCRTGPPDVLVNNAGVGLAGGLLATSLDDWQWILNVNLWGVVHGCHFFAPPMAARGRGQIINIASAAGYYNSQATTAYGTNRADWSYIPGGVISGTALIRPDLPELKKWPYFWQQTEYVMGGGETNYMFLVLAAAHKAK